MGEGGEGGVWMVGWVRCATNGEKKGKSKEVKGKGERKKVT